MPKFIPVADIIVPEKRQRTTFSLEAHQDLIESIEGEVGLLNAIVLREGNTLVAGERRLRAIKDIYSLGGLFKHDGALVPQGMVPFTDLAELPPSVAWQAELEENIKRLDLTWPERAAATAEWMAMREAQAAETGAAKPTLATVAADLRPDENPIAATDAVRKEIMVARHLNNPEVAAAPTIKEAIKILKKQEEREKNQALAAVLGESYGSDQLRLKQADCLDILCETADATWDIILTDPPYGIGAQDFGDSGTADAGAHEYDDSYEAWRDLIVEFAKESFRVAKPDAHAYLFCDVTRFAELAANMKAAGWKVFRTPIIWHNPGGLRAPWPEQGPQRKYECILFAVKGGKKVTSVKGDVLTYTRDAALGHFAQKPIELLIDLLKRSAKPGDKVVDFFAGSGSTIAACYEMKLECDAYEKSSVHYATAAARLKRLLDQYDIPF